jgi:hypothetical protein
VNRRSFSTAVLAPFVLAAAVFAAPPAAPKTPLAVTYYYLPG